MDVLQKSFFNIKIWIYVENIKKRNVIYSGT